jgi:conjugative relaxase-like TrwC/TraI family protein
VGGGLLSVAKLTLGQEAYYERQVARGLDDYYAGRGESPGIWAGAGPAGLGLVGVVGDDDLGTLLRGVNPANGERLRNPVRERTITRRGLDVETGEWREEPMQLKPVSGYDLVFSCPKSVSLLHALTDEESVRREISEAHEKAWQSALGYLEREACIVRRGKGGTIREHGEGFVGAAFRHRTSRAQDPHLHTHVVVANMTRTADGEWRALDGEAILKTYRLAAGYLYETHLRHELTRRLSVEWTEPIKGMGELRGVPEETIRAFSTRRRSLVAHMEALGTEGFTASRVAALATREAKEQVDLARLREDWKARAAEHGFGRRELEALRRHRPVARDRVELEQLAADLLGREGITEKQTTFIMPELVQAVAGALPAGAGVDEVLELADELSRFPGVELVGAQEAPGQPARFTTRELLAVEREAIELALSGLNIPVPAPERRPLAEALMSTGHELTGEQRMLVHEAACRSDRVVCVVGVAGSGKTLALRALVDAYRGIDATVLGAAPSGRAADELQTATGLPSRTLHRLRLDAQRDGGLPLGCVLVVDEAGMAETRVLGPLLHEVERAEGKLLLVGDPAQLPAVGAGGLYQALCDRLDVIELSGNRRQRDPLEREALARLRHGDPEPYLAHAARQHRLAVDDNPAIVRERLLADWWQEARRSPTRNVMFAYHRSDVDELNQAAHALMLRNRRLSREAVTLGDRNSGSASRSSAGTTTADSVSATACAEPSSTSTREASSFATGAASTGTSASPMRPSTSTTAMPSPATQPKASRSIAPSSSSPTRAPSTSGATSPAPAPACRPASTSPTARRSSARRHSANRTQLARLSVLLAPSNGPQPRRSRSTSAENPGTPSSASSPSSSGGSSGIASARPISWPPPNGNSNGCTGGTVTAAPRSKPRSRSTARRWGAPATEPISYVETPSCDRRDLPSARRRSRSPENATNSRPRSSRNGRAAGWRSRSTPHHRAADLNYDQGKAREGPLSPLEELAHALLCDQVATDRRLIKEEQLATRRNRRVRPGNYDRARTRPPRTCGRPGR